MADTKKDQETKAGDAGAPSADLVASRDDNAALEHTADGPTTRSDATDVGVPMLAGDPAEPIGPEDAFGPGPKRGLYAPRETGAHATVEVIPPGEREENGPTTRVVDQVARAAEQGEAPGKGGVPGTTPREDVPAAP